MKVKMTMTVDREMMDFYKGVFSDLKEITKDESMDIPKFNLEVKSGNKWNNLLYICHITDELDVKVEVEYDQEVMGKTRDFIRNTAKVLSGLSGLKGDLKELLEMYTPTNRTAEVENLE